MKYGATAPPAHGGNLRARNSKTGFSNRYCVHEVTCRYYRQSKEANNTVGFETDNINSMEEKLKELPELPGGIQKCGKCIKY